MKALLHKILHTIRDRRRGIMAERSPYWRSVEHENKKPACEACSTTKRLEVHHKRPFHLHPEDELKPSNLITLCRRCHLLLGHLDDWKAYNARVVEDAQIIALKIKHRLR